LPVAARRRGWFLRHPLLVVVVGAVLTVAGTGVFALVHDSGDVVLISVGQSQALAFDPTPHDPHLPGPDVSPPELDDDPVRRGGRVPGTDDGAHGSSRGAACDVTTLIRYFANHPAQASAWAGVHGIEPRDVGAYLRRLTPVRLRADTRVTNYDYKDGHADGFQAVLQAGTSVLIDDAGYLVPNVTAGTR